MTSFTKPLIRRKNEPTNALGLIRSDYDGAMSTLCAGCGHDGVTASMARAFFELAIEPHRAVKVSGIGCSSKTTAYFLQTRVMELTYTPTPMIWPVGIIAGMLLIGCLGVFSCRKVVSSPPVVLLRDL